MIHSKYLCAAALTVVMGAATAPANAQYSTPMRDVENADRSLFILNAGVTISSPYINGFLVFTSVPGKRTIVDQISVSCTTGSTDSIAQAFVQITLPNNGFATGPALQLVRTGPSGTGSVYSGTLSTRMLVDTISTTAGAPIYINVYHVDSVATAQCSGVLLGHTLVL